MQWDLRKIREKFGEKMAHLCRELFPTLLESEGLLYDLMISNFEPSKFLYNDIIVQDLEDDFRNFIYSLVKVDEKEKEVVIEKTPKQLLEEAGYNLYECHSDYELQSFRKYYEKSEELCTFHNTRLDKYYVFFAVKKGAEQITRSNFLKPQRQDEYGTSVICIQFSKNSFNSLSIKNRYNHVVSNCDATFNNNLDNIIPGLTKSFERTYGFNITKPKSSNFKIESYIRGNDGKFYKYNYEINNIYYCSNNIIIDNGVVKRNYQQNERYIIIDYFILDMKEKKIILYDDTIKDSFIDDFKKIDRVTIKKEKNRKYVHLEIDEKTIIIVLDEENRIVSYHNNDTMTIGDNFLFHNESLKTVYLENARIISDNFLFRNKNLKLIDAPLLEKIGNSFLYYNNSLELLSLPYLRMIGNDFLESNQYLKVIEVPKLEEVGKSFLLKNLCLTNIEFPNLTRIGNNFISNNTLISNAYMPYLEIVGSDFLLYNNALKNLSLPMLREIGWGFLRYNQKLATLELPSLKQIGKYYLENNEFLDTIVVPEESRNSFLQGKTFACNFKIKRL